VASAIDAPARIPGRTLRVRTVVWDYVALTKPRIIELLLITTVPVMMLAARGFPSVRLLVATLAGGTFAAGAANALNCYVDRDIDAVMRRTERRPLNRSAMKPANALVVGLVLGALSVGLLWVTTNALSALLALAAIAFYVLVYTMLLKRRTSSNIVWGGAAGCMPVLIGWSAVTGSLAWAPVVLFAVVFLWTPPHFWALAMQFRDDYAAAGVPMLPVVATPSFVAGRMIAYTWIMVAGGRIGARSDLSPRDLRAPIADPRGRSPAPDPGVPLVDQLFEPALRRRRGRRPPFALTCCILTGRGPVGHPEDRAGATS
jgi:protoheme IX farnesyltransferase